MANYNLVTTSTFQPFTYEELAMPIKAMKEEHDNAELALLTLQEQMAELEGKDLGNLTPQYKNFKLRLDNINNQLSTKGITPEVSKELQLLRRDYLSTISPIVKKVDELNTANTFRQKLISENPEIKFNSPIPTIEESLSGIEIDQGYFDPAKMRSAIVSNIAMPMENMLKGEASLKDRINYNDYIESTINNIKESYGDRIPGDFSVEDVVYNTFHNLYDTERSKRLLYSKKSNAGYSRVGSSSVGYEKGDSKPKKDEFGSHEPVVFKNGKLYQSSYWEYDEEGIPVQPKEENKSYVHAKYIANNKDVTSPYITVPGTNYKIPNTKHFNFYDNGESSIKDEYRDNYEKAQGYSNLENVYVIDENGIVKEINADWLGSDWLGGKSITPKTAINFSNIKDNNIKNAIKKFASEKKIRRDSYGIHQVGSNYFIAPKKHSQY